MPVEDLLKKMKEEFKAAIVKQNELLTSYA
jgi:hypothetical protein